MFFSATLFASVKDKFKIIPSFALLLVIIVHAFGILLPETGFDALWYHLPIVRDMADSRSIRVVPLVSQSDQPRLGEIVYLPGYILGGVFGVKVTAFIAMLILLTVTYLLARNFLDSSWSLISVLLVSVFHTVAWQATSAYVDLFRAIFEVGLIYLLTRERKLNREWLLLSLMFAGALMTKLVTLVFSLAIIAYVFLKRGFRMSVLMLAVLLLIYIFGKYPLEFFSDVGRELIGIREIVHGIISFVFLPFELTFHRESYLGPLFLFSTPFIFLERKWLMSKYFSEFVLIGMSMLTWVFVVPVSVRYNLSVIILLTILCISVLSKHFKKNNDARFCLLALVACSVILNTAIRVGSLFRAAPYLLGKESQEQYLERFSKGILKGPLESWYRVQ